MLGIKKYKSQRLRVEIKNNEPCRTLPYRGNVSEKAICYGAVSGQRLLLFSVDNLRQLQISGKNM